MKLLIARIVNYIQHNKRVYFGSFLVVLLIIVGLLYIADKNSPDNINHVAEDKTFDEYVNPPLYDVVSFAQEGYTSPESDEAAHFDDEEDVESIPSPVEPNPELAQNTPVQPPTPAPEPAPESEPPPPPPPPESPSAVVAFYADNQSDTDAEDVNHQRVLNYILNTNANPVFHAGDLMEDGTQDSLNRFNTVTSTLRAVRTFYAALGNNDRKVGDSSTPSQLYFDNFVFPNNEQWYSVNVGNLHMIILDSAFSAANQTQMNWLVADLQSAASQSRITGVMFHHPTFASSISTHLLNYGVDFVISGHNHVYQHTSSNGLHHFVTSGQPNIGYLLAKIYADKVELTAYNQNNGVVENVSFAER